jgi:hypothetical protein
MERALLIRTSNMHPRPKKRAAFVITVAVAALPLACGGSVDSDAGSGGTGGGISNPPPLPTPKTPCPALQPSQNTACSSPGQTCGYTGSDECGWEIDVTAQCAPDGRWDVTVAQSTWSCNPPPPPMDLCPTSEPTPGQWCNVIESKICTYPATCCESPYQCVDETWVAIPVECNPPAVACPAVAPKTGEACEPCGETFTPCKYDACATGGNISYSECSAGTWTTKQAACPK